ncbi:MAG: ABC-2 transporter permease [Chloroflexota bacterium]
MNALYQLALADFRERVRRFSFLVMVALAVLLGYQVIDGLFILRLGSYRGDYNAAWIGTLMAITLAFFLSLLGFYLVRGSVQLDRQTGVGQILAATPLRRVTYVLGKFASNTAVLLVIVAVLAVAALAMLLIHGEDRTLDLYQLLMPFVVFAVPVALLAAATAVFFDATPFLRETAGNVLYFFVWLFMVPAFGGHLLGFEVIEREMAVALQAQGADYSGGIVLGSTEIVEMQTFLWSGFDWTAVAGPRLIYVLAALLLAMLAAVPFDRFDPSRGRIARSTRPSLWQRGTSKVRAIFQPLLPKAFAVPPTPHAIRNTLRSDQLTAVTAANSNLSLFVQTVTAECKLLFKGRPMLWYAVAAGLVLLCLTADLETVQRWLLPLIWLWPLLLWSEMGVREGKYGVDQLLFSAPAPLWRQLPAAWTAGVLLYLLLGSGALLRFLVEPTLLPGFVAGALFIPSLALLLGVVGGSERPLQILLLIFWYLGPLNGLALFDFTGATPDALAQGIPWYYLGVSLPLLGLTLLARWRQIVS